MMTISPETSANEKPSSPRRHTTLLVATAALLVGGIAGGMAGAAIGSAGPSQELSETDAALDESASKLDDAERQITELESEIDTLESDVKELAPQAIAADAPDAPQPSGPAGNLPEGYPFVVQVSELPDQVRNWYEMGSHTEAVALAPGVWTELPPGADMESAIAAGIADGFCASVEAYERDYAKRDLAGTCW
ncbi:hypothetical protein LQ757_12965 [Agromyces sp. SYSU K20354]|uniref:hypothetical protein n=1 Tax=Agromyces cavernae TaxID=2898659 RepID=UPI001E414B2B|nr:hypothetical protein [Agromyces cavernae]MCD2443187.1 hypothetical protein [Agromyces cavernae]